MSFYWQELAFVSQQSKFYAIFGVSGAGLIVCYVFFKPQTSLDGGDGRSSIDDVI